MASRRSSPHPDRRRESPFRAGASAPTMKPIDGPRRGVALKSCSNHQRDARASSLADEPTHRRGIRRPESSITTVRAFQRPQHLRAPYDVAVVMPSDSGSPLPVDREQRPWGCPFCAASGRFTSSTMARRASVVTGCVADTPAGGDR